MLKVRTMARLLPLAMLVPLACIGSVPLSATYAAGPTVTRTAKIGHARVTLLFAREAADITSFRALPPRIGIPTSPRVGFSENLARAVSATNRAVGVPPLKLPEYTEILADGFEQHMQSEIDAATESACRVAHLNYFLILGMQRAPATAEGPTRNVSDSTEQEARLYDCPTRKPVWVAQLRFETSRDTAVLSRNTNETRAVVADRKIERAFATLFAQQLVRDMGGR